MEPEMSLHVHSNLPLISQLIPIQTLTPYFLKINFNLILYDNLTPIYKPIVLKNVGVSTSHNAMGLHGPLQG
jgi:hypothetical protein